MSDVRLEASVPEPAALLEVFETAGWNDMYALTAANLHSAFSTSWRSVAAYEEGRLVGIGRIISDGIQYGVIFDIIVIPDRRRGGIGSRIVHHLLEECRQAELRDVLLFSARGTVDFYRRFGFVERPDKAPGMLLRRRGAG